MWSLIAREVQQQMTWIVNRSWQPYRSTYATKRQIILLRSHKFFTGVNVPSKRFIFTRFHRWWNLASNANFRCYCKLHKGKVRRRQYWNTLCFFFRSLHFMFHFIYLINFSHYDFQYFPFFPQFINSGTCSFALQILNVIGKSKYIMGKLRQCVGQGRAQGQGPVFSYSFILLLFYLYF